MRKHTKLYLLFIISLFIGICSPLFCGDHKWTSIGPSGGHVQTLAMDDKGIIYAGTEHGGIFKSSDSGSNWQAINSGLSGLNKWNVQSIIINPINSDTIYVGILGGGVFKSGDKGISWLSINSNLGNLDIRTLAIDPLKSDTIYAGTNDGIFRTMNDGESWQSINTGFEKTSRRVEVLVMDPSNSSILYAGIERAGVYQSQNGGAKWDSINTGGLTSIFIRTLAINPQNTDVIYVGTTEGFYKSSDAGSTWISANNGLENNNILSLAVDPYNGNLIYAGTFKGVYKTTDAGNNWSRVQDIADYRVWDLTIDSSKTQIIFAGTAKGIYKSTNAGVSWIPNNAGLNSLPIREITLSDQNSIYCATLEGIFKSDDSGSNWTIVADNNLTNDDIMALACDLNAPNVIYAGTYGSGVFKSEDKAESWVQINSGLTKLRINKLIIDPLNISSLYAVTIAPGSIFKSVNSGSNWSEKNTGLPSGNIFALAIDHQQKDVIYVGIENRGVYKSTNGGDSWNPMNNGLENLNIQGMAVDPTNSNILFAATENGVFKSVNAGAFWMKKSDGLTSSDIRDVVIDSTFPDVVYANTANEGVFQTTNAGESWVAINNGLAVNQKDINCLSINPYGHRKIYTGTTGSSIFEYYLKNRPPTIISLPDTTATEDDFYEYQLIADDRDAWDNLFYSFDEMAPDGMVIDSSNGHISWTPTNAHVTGDIILQHKVVVKVEDPDGANAVQTFFLKVNNTDPVIDFINDITILEDSLYTYDINSDDERESPELVTYSLLEPPEWLSINTSNGKISGTPLNNHVGSKLVTAEVEDGHQGIHRLTYRITVENIPPGITTFPINSAIEDSLYKYDVNCNDDGQGEVHYTLINPPDWLTIDSMIGMINGTPNNSHVTIEDSIQVIVEVNDGNANNNISRQEYHITIKNSPPVIESVPITRAIPEASYRYDIYCNDEKQGKTRYEKVTMPHWLQLDPIEGIISGVPALADTGGTVSVKINDGNGGEDTQTYYLKVLSEFSNITLSESQKILVFGNVQIGDSTTLSLIIKNRGNIELVISKMSVKETAFRLANIESTIAPDDSSTIEITFRPTTARQYTDFLKIHSNDPLQPTFLIGLIGYGYESRPAIDISEKRHDFGRVPVGDSSLWTLTLFNHGDDVLNISKMNLTQSVFILSDISCVIEPDSSRDITVTFTPGDTSHILDTLSIYCDVPLDSLVRIPLSGTGTQGIVAVSDTVLDFKNITLGRLVSDTLIILNKGNDYLKVSEFGITDTIFTMSAVGTFIIEENNSLIVPISFKPVELKTYEDSLIIKTSDPANPRIKIRLSGTGIRDSYTRIEHQPIYEAPKGIPISISAVVTDTLNGVSSVHLFFRKGGQITFQQLDMSSGTATIPGTMVTMQGIEYFITAFDGAGNPTSLPYKDFFSVNIFSAGEGETIPAIQLDETRNVVNRLFSIPLILRNPSPGAVLIDDLGEYKTTEWRFFEYLDNEFHEYPNTNNFMPGKAFVLLTKRLDVDIDTGPGTSVPTSDTSHYRQIILKDGWNFIGNPFNFEMMTQNLTLENGETLANFWLYENNMWTLQPLTFEPWKGYVLKTNSAVKLLINPNTGRNPGLRKVSPIDSIGIWDIYIQAECEGAKDYYNIVGVRADASFEWDRYDRYEPPPIGNYVMVNFPHKDWSIRPDIYAFDFQPISLKGNCWDFETTTSINNSEIKLHFSGMESIPENFHIYLIDKDLKISQNLHLKESYSYPSYSAKTPRKFRLLVGTEDFIKTENMGIEMIPESYKLFQNFPNPFNQQTSIIYALPEGGKITLRIFNILGEVVKTLVDDEYHEHGYYITAWDGTDKRGVNVAGGIYFFQINMGGFKQIKRSLLIK